VLFDRSCREYISEESLLRIEKWLFSIIFRGLSFGKILFLKTLRYFLLWTFDDNCFLALFLDRIDLFILMTFLVTIQDSTSKFLRLSIIFKVGYIMDTYDSIANMLEIKNKNKHIPIFLKVVFQILVVAHLAGCFFIKLALTN